ncbi:carboxylating nicotinate-nucleotide diphosphorylase [bacterium]|nr:carboxylating nicotinate-nucleotide diphosphorylase [bacterium]
MTEEVLQVIRLALQEDLPRNSDATTDWLISRSEFGEAWIEARQHALVAGLEVVRGVFREVDAELRVEVLSHDGDRVAPMERVMTFAGSAASILKAERTALNFLSHLSGIATHTATLVEMTKPYGTKVWCTRKTTPGWRMMEVHAVRAGGGDTFRSSLDERILVKDNHLGLIGGMDGLKRALSSASNRDEILREGKTEVASLEELDQAIEMGWTKILLDNFTPDQVREAVRKHAAHAALEASGGINRANLVEYAKSGVEAISLGELTHSVRAADFALEVSWKR